jgi:hypothetical protein
MAFPVQASPTTSGLEPRSLARAQTIRAQIDVRYRVLPRRGLAVTEATSTGVVESFALLTPDLLETRFLPADNGIYYAICPVRATCPYPVGFANSAVMDFQGILTLASGTAAATLHSGRQRIRAPA